MPKLSQVIVLFSGLLLLNNFTFAEDTYDASTGKLSMPDVNVGGIHYAVEMQNQGDLTFKVTTASEITPATTDSTVNNSIAGLWYINTSSRQSLYTFTESGKFGEANFEYRDGKWEEDGMWTGTYQINGSTLTVNETRLDDGFSDLWPLRPSSG